MQRRFARVLAILAILAAAPIAPGAEPDASSPKAALKSLHAAIERSDGEAIRKLMTVENDGPEQEMLNAYVNFVVASGKLGAVVKKKFPGGSDPFAAGALAPEDAAQIDAATASVDGDRATVTLEGQESTPRKLKRVNGAWKLLATEPADANPKHRAEQVTMIMDMTEAINSATEDITNDKFATVAEAKDALKQRLGAIVAKALQSNPPTSRPTSRSTD